MQLVKNIIKKEVEFICDGIQTKYIQPYWMDIKDDYNQNIGISFPHNQLKAVVMFIP